MSRTAERQVSFADWELMRQGLRLEPLLQAISDFLDGQKDMIEQVRCDLRRGLKKAETGRSGLTPQQVLRSLVLMRVKNWNYRELRERIADGCTLRQFTDFYCLPVPRHDAFHRGFNRLTPETLKAINDLVVQAAVDLGLEDGQKLRVDTTVVQTDIHHPTDNTLLWDVVRVVTRLIGHLAAALGRRRIKGFRDRTRSARRRMQEIQRMTSRQRQQQQTGRYRELIGIAEEVIEGARAALWHTRKARGTDMITELAIAETRKEIEHFCALGVRVINQSRRRVLNGEQVPTAEKLYSIFEPHTDLIKRGKVQTPVEFGHKVFLAESARGLITQYEVLDGNPLDEQHVVISLARHKQTFGDVPKLYGSDVRPAKAGMFSRSKTYRGKSQNPVAWIAEVMETETLKPIDKVSFREICESPGRNNSERISGPEMYCPREPSSHPMNEGIMNRRSLTDTSTHLGGVEATAR